MIWRGCREHWASHGTSIPDTPALTYDGSGDHTRVASATRYRYPKRSQYKYTKKPHRVQNWPAYETALRKRGELTLSFSWEAIEAWSDCAQVPSLLVAITRDSLSTKSRHHTVWLIGEVGVKCWRISSGYMRRSLVETATSRFNRWVRSSIYTLRGSRRILSQLCVEAARQITQPRPRLENV